MIAVEPEMDPQMDPMEMIEAMLPADRSCMMHLARRTNGEAFVRLVRGAKDPEAFVDWAVAGSYAEAIEKLYRQLQVKPAAVAT